MSAGTTYTVQIVWKTNKAAIGATIAAGAGPIGSSFSPTRLTADVLPAGYQSVVSTQQYSSVNSNGSTWSELDATHLVTTAFAPSSPESVVVSGNADLWTANAGYNQDLGTFVSVNGATPVLVAWKESGGFAGTFSPNAAFVQAVYPMTAGNSYVFSLWWKANKPTNGTIFVGAGPIGSAYSPTRLTVYPPTNSAPDQWATAVSTQQYSSVNSNGSTWAEMDPTNLATPAIAIGSGGTVETVLVSGNADLWTANSGYNQDVGIEVSVNGATPVLVAWKESGGFAGTYSPNAAFVQAVYTMEPGEQLRLLAVVEGQQARERHDLRRGGPDWQRLLPHPPNCRPPALTPPEAVVPIPDLAQGCERPATITPLAGGRAPHSRGSSLAPLSLLVEASDSRSAGVVVLAHR